MLIGRYPSAASWSETNADMSINKTERVEF
jgi:hypothetical protein